MANDLFVALNANKITELQRTLEQRVGIMVDTRHDYPIWPEHGGSPSDAYEREFHRPIRQIWYMNTIFMIQILRRLREVTIA